jgi:hypothetical protein
MPDTWCIYHIPNCRQSSPPKDKLVVIVCKDSKPRGFFINSSISQFVRNSPALLEGQVTISALNQKCLAYDSYIDCSDLVEFDSIQLVNKRENLHEQTVAAIKGAMRTVATVETRYRKLILGE